MCCFEVNVDPPATNFYLVNRVIALVIKPFTKNINLLALTRRCFDVFDTQRKTDICVEEIILWHSEATG